MKFKVLNRGKQKIGEILIYEEIGEGFFGGISAKSFAASLKDLGKVDSIEVRINSIGGSVFDGITIYNQLANHPASIHVEIDGLAASIATIIAMAGDTISIADNGFFMIHNPNTLVVGESSDLRKAADLLDTARETLLDTYMKRLNDSGVTRETISKAMDAETWYTAEEARDIGLVDSVSDQMAIAACGDLSKFRHTPANIVAQTKTPDVQRIIAAREKVQKMVIFPKK